MHPSWNDYPHLVAELDPDGNKDMTLYGKPISVLELTLGTNKKIDWKCSTCQHQWTTTGNHRVSHGSNCSFCSGRSVHSDGRNSMANTHPELAFEYQGDATKVMAGTGKKLLWKCRICEHEWETTGSSRVQGHGCAACTNKAVHSDGRNSMAVTHPDLAVEYQGDATQVIAGTGKKLPWKCRTCDNEWETTGHRRVMGRGCHYCNSGRLHSDGRNSMAMTHPELAKEYQGDATQIVAGTYKMLSWKCLTVSENPCGYEWPAVGKSRSKQGAGCSACATYGFKPNEPAHYYVHKILNESGEFLMYKGGIAKNWKSRLQQLRQSMSDNLTIENHEVIDFEIGQDARDLETTLLRMAAKEGWKAPKREFDGGSELFLENPLDHARIHGLI